MPMFRLRRFWASYRLSKLSADVRQRAVFVVKMACLVRCFREYGIDLTLVSCAAHCRLLCSQLLCKRKGEYLMQCVGPSMLPTFNEKGDLVLLEHYSVYAERIQPGRCFMVPLFPATDSQLHCQCRCLSDAHTDR